MKPITLEGYLSDPGLDLRLHAQARRERAALMRRMAMALMERLTPRPGPVHWIARLG
jgi:hypothetical protein